jgi:hypothetical protein
MLCTEAAWRLAGISGVLVKSHGTPGGSWLTACHSATTFAFVCGRYHCLNVLSPSHKLGLAYMLRSVGPRKIIIRLSLSDCRYVMSRNSSTGQYTVSDTFLEIRMQKVFGPLPRLGTTGRHSNIFCIPLYDSIAGILGVNERIYFCPFFS